MFYKEDKKSVNLGQSREYVIFYPEFMHPCNHKFRQMHKEVWSECMAALMQDLIVYACFGLNQIFF
jgi:hypothetical protein